jgi:RimJ/RimL family protein N-acetyltransferase
MQNPKNPAVSPSAAPTLETERLILRALSVADYEALHANWSDPIIFKYTTGKASAPEESWNRLMRYFGHWPALGYGFWAVVEKSSNTFIGEIGIADFKRGITPSLDGRPEFGWILSSAAHGKGYATEALADITAWADENLDAEFTSCIIDPGNFASINVAKKIGFTEIATSTYHGELILVFERKKR